MPLADPNNPLNAQVPDLSALIDRFAEGQLEEPDYSTGQDYSGAAERFGGSGHDTGDLTTRNIFNPDGTITGRAATFATQGDLSNYAKTGSLATGDNGIGAFGARTSGDTPYVAVPRDVLTQVYGHEDAAKGKHVEVTSPNGRTAIIEIGDKGPRLANRRNNAVIELNPAAIRELGSGDSAGYKYRFID